MATQGGAIITQQIHQDWVNREYIEVIYSLSYKTFHVWEDARIQLLNSYW